MQKANCYRCEREIERQSINSKIIHIVCSIQQLEKVTKFPSARIKQEPTNSIRSTVNNKKNVINLTIVSSFSKWQTSQQKPTIQWKIVISIEITCGYRSIFLISKYKQKSSINVLCIIVCNGVTVSAKERKKEKMFGPKSNLIPTHEKLSW